MSLSDEFMAYMVENAPRHPFKAHAGAVAMAQALRTEGHTSAAEVQSIQRIERTIQTFWGPLSLHLDNEWSSALRAKRWWEKRKFAATEDEWKARLRKKLTEEAAADVDAIRRRYAMRD